MNSRPLRRLPGLWLLLLLPLAASAQESTARAAGLSSDEKELHKITGIFDTDLPKTERKGSVRLIVHPHLGDFTSRSYLRVDTEGKIRGEFSISRWFRKDKSAPGGSR